jgi:drug/metabolite transporter (DMT)-like permease
MRRWQPRDVIWGVTAVLVSVLFWVGANDILFNYSEREANTPYIGSLLLLGLVSFWVGLGAWRRTRWGHTSPRPAWRQFLLLEVVGLALGAALFTILKLA